MCKCARYFYKMAAPVHVAPACAGSGEGSNNLGHFILDQIYFAARVLVYLQCHFIFFLSMYCFVYLTIEGDKECSALAQTRNVGSGY
jgi:hypothetical protein